MNYERKQWPVLLVSQEINRPGDDAFRLDELVDELTGAQECTVMPSLTYEDALEIFESRADFGAILLDWDLPTESHAEKMLPHTLLAKMRKRNRTIPILLLTDKLETEKIPVEALAMINGCLWKTADTVSFLAGRIAEHLDEYVAQVYPQFFGELVEYSHKYKYAWHTPGHLGGQGFLRAPAGVAMYKFFGENTFRADLSISVPELGSLLDHSGVTGDAENNSAKAFGADMTFYVLNGTSTVNQIIWHSQVLPGDLALVDRNCHKSLNYAMVITGATPMYMIPRRNKRGIIGPVRLEEFSKNSIQKKIHNSKLLDDNAKKCKVKMSALTNSTYDGICYNVRRIKDILEDNVEFMHFDEAWYAYAKFNPIYDGFYGMASGAVKPKDPPIFCSQSTHKLLTAFSQASMLHIKQGGTTKINRDEFNEAYMMHGSTSPQYSMIASLDVATKMMQDSGEVIIGDIIHEAVQLRKKTAQIANDYMNKNDWFFDLWQPRKVLYNKKYVDFYAAPTEYLATNRAPWLLCKENNWHDFADIEDEYVMLDPIKLTFTTPGIDPLGKMTERGIPASIVSNYLIKHNIVCEKTDYYSFLMLNSLGTTRAKQGTLLAALLKFKQDYDSNVMLEEVFPEIVELCQAKYAKQTLKEHCLEMHKYIRTHALLDKMQLAFEVIPDQAMAPCDAFKKVVAKEVEYVFLDKMTDRIPAVMMVPYPPGIPIVMGGEILNAKAKPILDYLRARQSFENEFPGYEGDIHGVERENVNNQAAFKTLCIKKGADK